jgi:hypothetical protein
MNKTLNAVRRGIKAAMKPPRSHRYEAAGKTIVCSHCGHDLFELVGVAGLTAAGYGIYCACCSHAEYFVNRPKEQD